jgi:molecular chaperone HscB
LKQDFKIDASWLEKNYRSSQMQVHPDRFFNSSSKEKDLSEQMSSCINEGYQTLRNPMKRAEYLLKLHGKKTVAEVGSDFLMNVLELHEQIEESSNPEDLLEMLHKNDQQLSKELSLLSGFLSIENNQIKHPDEAALALSKIRYLNRIKELIQEKLPAEK